MPKQDKKLIRRRMVNAYLSSVVSISLVLLLIGIASLVLINAGSISRYLKENVKMSVMLKADAGDDDAEEYKSSVITLPYVKGARVVTREEGARELEAMLGEDFLSVFETSPVPVSVEVSLRAEYMVPDSLDMVCSALKASPLVDELDDRRPLVEALDSSIARISLFFGILILLLLSISFVLINNMVRLSVFARRFTIHTMKLVGATRAFIRKPFLKAALVQGLVSALVASLIMFGLLFALKGSFPELYAAVGNLALLLSVAAVVLCGVLICVLSTFVVVDKLVAADKDDLYY